MSTIKFAKVLIKLLDTKEIQDKIKKRIYPLVAPLNTLYPYVVFQRIDSGQYTKDNRYQDDITYNIIVANDDYDNGLDIAEMIVSELDGKRNILIDGYKIASIKLTNTSEDYNDAYLQNLTFEFRINL